MQVQQGNMEYGSVRLFSERSRRLGLGLALTSFVGVVAACSSSPRINANHASVVRNCTGTNEDVKYTPNQKGSDQRVASVLSLEKRTADQIDRIYDRARLMGGSLDFTGAARNWHTSDRVNGKYYAKATATSLELGFPYYPDNLTHNTSDYGPKITFEFTHDGTAQPVKAGALVCRQNDAIYPNGVTQLVRVIDDKTSNLDALSH